MYSSVQYIQCSTETDARTKVDVRTKMGAGTAEVEPITIIRCRPVFNWVGWFKCESMES